MKALVFNCFVENREYGRHVWMDAAPEFTIPGAWFPYPSVDIDQVYVHRDKDSVRLLVTIRNKPPGKRLGEEEVKQREDHDV